MANSCTYIECVFSGVTEQVGNEQVYAEIVNATTNIVTTCVQIVPSIIDDPAPKDQETDCGCPIPTCDQAIKIEINCVEPVSNGDFELCEYDEVVLDRSGYVFLITDGAMTGIVSPECCKQLGYTSVETPDGHMCRWYKIEEGGGGVGVEDDVIGVGGSEIVGEDVIAEEFGAEPTEGNTGESNNTGSEFEIGGETE